MDDFLSKPILMTSLEAMLDKWIRIAGAQGEAATAAENGTVSSLPPTDPDAIDLPTMAKLEEIDDGADFVSELIKVFLADLDTRIAEIQLQVEKDDKKGISGTAHAIKGSCGHFGARSLMAICASIEAQARHSPEEDVKASVIAMIAQARKVREALLEYQRLKSAPASTAAAGTTPAA